MNDDNGFYTQKGYQLNKANELTASMEDYLEMICRMLKNTDVVRINELAERLHVKPSSASKMVSNLRQVGYIDFQKYGYIAATKKGLEVGRYLLYRHDVLHKFLCMLNNTENELDQVEKIEHFINKSTLKNLEKLTNELIKKEKSAEPKAQS
jgi:Mn-dependent DtxR family transcriptional regulator